jgi:hypothetical protein
MFKGFLATLIFVLSMNVHSYSNKGSFFISHEEFTQLNEYEQNKIIISYMEFAASVEAMYEKELNSTTPNTVKLNTLKKAVDILRSNLFITEAFAQEEDKNLQKSLDRFNRAHEASKISKNNNCLYAGWLSQTDKNHVCVHPKNLTALKLTDYQSDPKCKSPSITCNPLIFGHKGGGKELFCVPAGTSVDKSGSKKSENSSLNCLDLAKNDQEALKKLRDTYNAKPEFYNRVTTMVHQACLCETPIHMDKMYFNKIRPHRTCYALLKQYKEIRNGDKCEAFPTGLSHEFVTKLQEALDIENFSTDPKIMVKNVDKNYIAILDDFKKNSADFCKLDPEITPVCETICAAPTANGDITCKVTIKDGTSKTTSLTFKKGDNAEREILALPKWKTKAADNKKIMCKAPSLETKCNVTKCEKKDDKLVCEFSLEGATPKDKDQKTFTAKAVDEEVEIPIDGESKTVLCKAIAEQQKSSCSIALTAIEKDSDHIKAVVKITLAKGDKVKKPTFSSGTFESTADPLIFNGTLPHKDKTTLTVSGFSTDFPGVDVKCEETFPKEKPTEGKYSIDIKGKSSANQLFIIVAVVKSPDGNTYEGEKKLDHGLTIVWYEKGKPEPTAAEKAAKEKADKEKEKKEAAAKLKKADTGQAHDPKEEDDNKKEVKEKTEKATEEVKNKVKTGTDLGYSAPIIQVKYEVCANLMKDGKVEASDCEKIPLYMAPGQGQQGPPPMPGAYRYRRW